MSLFSVPSHRIKCFRSISLCLFCPTDCPAAKSLGPSFAIAQSQQSDFEQSIDLLILLWKKEAQNPTVFSGVETCEVFPLRPFLARPLRGQFRCAKTYLCVRARVMGNCYNCQQLRSSEQKREIAAKSHDVSLAAPRLK